MCGRPRASKRVCVDGGFMFMCMCLNCVTGLLFALNSRCYWPLLARAVRGRALQEHPNQSLVLAIVSWSCAGMCLQLCVGLSMMSESVVGTDHCKSELCRNS